jgi:hypothetical protein
MLVPGVVDPIEGTFNIELSAGYQCEASALQGVTSYQLKKMSDPSKTVDTHFSLTAERALATYELHPKVLPEDPQAIEIKIKGGLIECGVGAY